MGHADSKFERREQILDLLLSSQTYLSVNEIAQKLKCHRSTVYRHLDEISLNHNLIEDNGCFFLDATEYISNIRLRSTEALSIYLALRRYIRQTTHAPDFMVTALHKVSVALRHPQLTDYLLRSSSVLQEERAASIHHTEIWRVIIQGWMDSCVVEIDYQKPEDNHIVTHDIEPYLFEPAVLGHGTYVIAWSRTRGGQRIFKLNRIKSARLTDQKFSPDEIDVEALLAHAWGIWYGEKPIRIELLFAPDVADRVQETMRHPSEKYQLQPDGSLYWTVEVAAYRELLPWIQGWGSKVEVLAPSALRQKVAAEMRAAALLYGG